MVPKIGKEEIYICLIKVVSGKIILTIHKKMKMHKKNNVRRENIKKIQRKELLEA